jgi:hypothetical protein
MGACCLTLIFHSIGSASSITGISMKVNYLGQAWASQQWTFEVYLNAVDSSAASWAKIGDTSSDTSGWASWTYVLLSSLLLPGVVMLVDFMFAIHLGKVVVLLRVACCCVLLRVACCCVLRVACCCVLLRVVACCCVLLRIVAYCCVLLRVIAVGSSAASWGRLAILPLIQVVGHLGRMYCYLFSPS